MSHPDRKIMRERQKAAKKEKMPGRKNLFDRLDLTPYNAVGVMRNPRFTLKLK